MRIGPGRDPETRKRVARAIMDAVEDVTRAVFASRGLGLSVEIREIDNTAAIRVNNLHERMKARA